MVPAADVITPNQFELGFLTDTEPRTLDETLDSADRAMAMGPSTVLVTSVERPDAPADTIEMMAVTGEGAWIVQTPRLPMKANGSGDVTAALFTAHLHTTGSPGEALAATVSSVFDLLQATLDSGERELRLIAGPGRLRAPAAAVRGHAGPLTHGVRAVGLECGFGVTRWHRSHTQRQRRSKSQVMREPPVVADRVRCRRDPGVQLPDAHRLAGGGRLRLAGVLVGSDLGHQLPTVPHREPCVQGSTQVARRGVVPGRDEADRPVAGVLQGRRERTPGEVAADVGHEDPPARSQDPHGVRAVGLECGFGVTRWH